MTVITSSKKRKQLVCVDLADIETRKDEVVAQLMDAAENVGFFYIKNHGIAQSDIDAAFELNRQFLELPKDVKKKYRTDTSNAAYIMGFSEELCTASTLRAGMLVAYDNEKMKSIWPEAELPQYKPDMLAFMLKCHAVVERVMSCFARGLGLPDDFFKDPMDPAHPDCGTACYCNLYPSLEGIELPPGVLRIFAHTDFEMLTLLFQRMGQPGLEVCPGFEAGITEQSQTISAEEGGWVAMDPREGAITCNIGDALQYWSDGRLHSTYHRVRTPGPGEYRGARQSLAYFSNARDSTLLQGPLKRYPPVTFTQILEEKKRRSDEVDKMDEEMMAKLSPDEYLAMQSKFKIFGPNFHAEDEAPVPVKPAVPTAVEVK